MIDLKLPRIEEIMPVWNEENKEFFCPVKSIDDLIHVTRTGGLCSNLTWFLKAPVSVPNFFGLCCPNKHVWDSVETMLPHVHITGLLLKVKVLANGKFQEITVPARELGGGIYATSGAILRITQGFNPQTYEVTISEAIVIQNFPDGIHLIESVKGYLCAGIKSTPQL